MALLVWLLSGLLLGLLKRLLMPGPPGGLVATLTLSMIRALIGGYIATYFELGTRNAAYWRTGHGDSRCISDAAGRGPTTYLGEEMSLENALTTSNWQLI